MLGLVNTESKGKREMKKEEKKKKREKGQGSFCKSHSTSIESSVLLLHFLWEDCSSAF